MAVFHSGKFSRRDLFDVIPINRGSQRVLGMLEIAKREDLRPALQCKYRRLLDTGCANDLQSADTGCWRTPCTGWNVEYFEKIREVP